MKKTLAILFASTALSVAFGLPAWSAMSNAVADGVHQAAAAFDAAQDALPVIRINDDEDDDDDDRQSGQGRDDDDDDDDDDDEECGDDDGCAAGRNPAPAGSMAPPQNGLFGNGAPPQVQVN